MLFINVLLCFPRSRLLGAAPPGSPSSGCSSLIHTFSELSTIIYVIIKLGVNWPKLLLPSGVIIYESSPGTLQLQQWLRLSQDHWLESPSTRRLSHLRRPLPPPGTWIIIFNLRAHFITSLLNFFLVISAQCFSLSTFFLNHPDDGPIWDHPTLCERRRNFGFLPWPVTVRRALCAPFN